MVGMIFWGFQRNHIFVETIINGHTTPAGVVHILHNNVFLQTFKPAGFEYIKLKTK